MRMSPMRMSPMRHAINVITEREYCYSSSK